MSFRALDEDGLTQLWGRITEQFAPSCSLLGIHDAEIRSLQAWVMNPVAKDMYVRLLRVGDMELKGSISYGTWEGTPIADAYISSAAAWNGKYAKPSGGIPESDLASAVTTKLSHGETAYGWGNHATAGYQSAITDVTDSVSGYVSKVTQTSGRISVIHAAFTAPTVAWMGGTTAGPKLAVTTDGGTSSSVAIPSASNTASGIVTTGLQTFAGSKTFATDTFFSSNTIVSYSSGTQGHYVGVSDSNYAILTYNGSELSVGYGMRADALNKPLQVFGSSITLNAATTVTGVTTMANKLNFSSTADGRSDKGIYFQDKEAFTIYKSGSTNYLFLGYGFRTTHRTRIYGNGVYLYYYDGTTVTDALSVAPTTGAVTIKTATSLSGTLSVTGNTTLGGTLGVTGATTLGGTLSVTGNTTIGSSGTSASLQVYGGITVEDTAAMHGDVVIGYNGQSPAPASLTVYGATSLKSTLEVLGATTIGADGTASTLDVWGAATLKSTLDITGEVTSTENIRFPAASKGIYFAYGTGTYREALAATSSNFRVAYGTGLGGNMNTSIYGKNIYLRYRTSSSASAVGLTLDTSGDIAVANNLTVGGDTTVTGYVEAGNYVLGQKGVAAGGIIDPSTITNDYVKITYPTTAPTSSTEGQAGEMQMAENSGLWVCMGSRAAGVYVWKLIATWN